MKLPPLLLSLALLLQNQIFQHASDSLVQGHVLTRQSMSQPSATALALKSILVMHRYEVHHLCH